MAIPFALALTVGSYLLLLFVYATLFSLATHVQFVHVQFVQSADPACAKMVTVHDFALASLLDDTRESPLSRRLWDPGIRSTECRVDPTARRQWDPGTWYRSPFAFGPSAHASIGFGLHDVVLTMMTVTMPSRRQWDPGIAKDGIDRSFYFELPTSHPNVVVVTMARTKETTLTPSASIFHYCHPVLSRPTVPNII